VINAHLWEFPNVELTSNSSSAEEAALTLVKTAPSALEPLCVIKHTITRYRITLDAYRATIKQRPPSMDGQSRWLKWEELKPLPFTSAHRKILGISRPLGRPA